MDNLKYIEVAKLHLSYFEHWIETPDCNTHIKEAALTISKKWMELINSSSTTQNDINSVMKELLSPDEFWGSGWSSMTQEFRGWAENSGFTVPSEKEVNDYYDSIFQNMIKKYREENRRKNE